MHDASASATAELGAESTRDAREKRWYVRVVHGAFRRGLARWGARRAEVRNRVDAQGAHGCALSAIRHACFKSAAAGAFAGSVATGAAVLTAETKGWGALAGVPLTAGAIAAEMFFRAILHAELACQLAEIYGVPFDAEDEDDLWRLYTLAFQTCGDARGGAPRNTRLIERITRLGRDQAGDAIGRRVLRDALLRDSVPFLDVVVSSVSNYVDTRRLGNAMRRFMRYERGMRDALDRAKVSWPAYIDLVIEGMWFIFSADGALSPEEAAMLAHMLRELEPGARREVMGRFVDDERDWIERVRTRLPEEVREPFVHTLEVAAALDKRCFVPERKILTRMAEALGRSWNAGNVERLIAELSETGVARQ
ncbi:MAG TPA: hypothetical protein VF765_03670 [Polyangiaceae bacterium]